MDKDAAIRRLDALDKEARELRKIIEEPQKITDRINGYGDILRMSGVLESDDEVKVRGFNDAENLVVKNIIKHMRTVKVYNGGKVLGRKDRRYTNWYDVSSGFDYGNTSYDAAYASTFSASLLCLKEEVLARDMAKKFPDIAQGIMLG